MTSISLIPFRHLKMQVQRKLNQSLQLAEAYFKRKFTMPEVNYDLRGITAGVAYLQKNEIKFNRCKKIWMNLFDKLCHMSLRI